MTKLTQIASRLNTVLAAPQNKAAAKALSDKLRKLFVSKGAQSTRSFIDKDQDPDNLYYCFSISVMPGIPTEQLTTAACKILGNGKAIDQGNGDNTFKYSKKLDGFTILFYDDTADAGSFVISVLCPTKG